METATVSAMSVVLVNLLLGCFCLLCLCGLINVIQCFIYDLRREKREREQAQREREKAERELEYHAKRMNELQ